MAVNNPVCYIWQMKKRMPQLLAGFIGIYIIVHAAYNLPNLVHGDIRLVLPAYAAHPLIYSIIDMLAASLFVTVPYLLLQRFYTQGKIWYAAVVIVPVIAVIFFVNYAIHRTLIFHQGLRLRSYFNDNLFFICVYLLYAVIFYLIRLSFYKELQQKELLLQNRQGELSFLRSQVNPHFLFNSLNNIYALVYEGSPQALQAISGLSELLRYMLYDTNEKVPLDKELEYIKKYIGLQKLRFEHEIKSDLQISGKTGEVQIPPLLLVPFIENAFKHGDFSAPGEGFNAIVSCTANNLYFYCRNKKGRGEKDAGGGIGLTNIRRRLELLYPGRHVLEIQDDNDYFTVNVELPYE